MTDDAPGAVALERDRLRAEMAEIEHRLRQRTDEMERLLDIGLALSSERDLEALQQLILTTSRQLTGADAGTLYRVEDDERQGRALVFHIAQNDSIDAPYQRLVMPLDTRSVAGYAASTGRSLRLDDVYSLPPDAEYGFSPAFDERFGYRTRSMLIVPMLNYHGTVVGVIQLINRKRHPEARLRDRAAVEREVEPFTAGHQSLLASFASQAAVALENKVLLDAVLRREEHLKQEVRQLRVEIDMAKQARQVAEITDTDYFRDLQQKARAMRGRKTGGE